MGERADGRVAGVVAGASGRRTICLNLIVKNEAHIVHEMIDAVAPFIDYWVIVDTGSTDGTQDVVRDHMRRLGIPGELHERPWRDFGHNRSEALQLAQRHCDYIWVMDADDTLLGTPDFTGLTAEGYSLRIDDGVVYWRTQLFRDGVPWRYSGVLHELAVCDEPHTVLQLGGDFRVISRRLGGRNLSSDKYLRDAEVLLAEVERHPDDARSVFYLAQSYYCHGDYANSRKWDQRRVEMGGWEEEVYYSMFRVAEAMAQLDEPWAEVQDAYLRAWSFRPTRAEALHALARRCRLSEKYALGHLFAQRAAQLPLPDDVLFLNADIHAWRALDEQGVCASWIGRPVEAFEISRQVLSTEGISDDDRIRIAGNRDLMVPQFWESVLAYPDDLPMVRPPGGIAEITVSLVVGPNRAEAEEVLNSFIHSCLDIGRVERFLVLDGGLSMADRTVLSGRYPFLEFIPEPALDDGGEQLKQIRKFVNGRYWLQLWQGWRFFAPDNIVSRLEAVLKTERQVFQVGVNFEDARALIGRCASDSAVRRAPGAGRYVPSDAVINGPAMFDVRRADAWKPGETLHTATLDEVLCTAERP